MKIKHGILLFISIFITGLSFGQRYYIVDKGCVKDNFTVKFPEQNISLEPDKFFSLNQLNLKVSPRVADVAGRDNLLKLYKAKNVISYKITIVHPSDNKLYYGRIAFFSVNYKHQNEAVASFYKITIPETYFQQANDGRSACTYEYYHYRGKHNFITWMIWLSDVPID